MMIAKWPLYVYERERDVWYWFNHEERIFEQCDSMSEKTNLFAYAHVLGGNQQERVAALFV